MQQTSAVDDYIARFPEPVRYRLEALRALARTQLPQAHEKMAYGILTYHLSKNLFHFGGFASHIGLYPGSAAIEAFAAELTAFKTSKGTIQVPHSAPLPLDLVARLIAFNLSTLVPKKKLRT